MKPIRRRAANGHVELVRKRSGVWAIRWGRRLVHEAGVSLYESTGQRDRERAQRVLAARQIEVYSALGDPRRADAARASVRPVALDLLATEFVEAYKKGILPGRNPAKATVALTCNVLFAARGGLLAYGRTVDRTTSDRFDAVFVTRWLEGESRRVSTDSVRIKLCVSRRLADFAVSRGYMSDAARDAIRKLPRPPASKPRARVQGVPSMDEIERLLAMLRPTHWRIVAELQFRLGLRRCEVLALTSAWLDPRNGTVNVLVDEHFDTKSHRSRKIDGVDEVTFELAREVIALKGKLVLTASGYREAFERACERLARRGTPWLYGAKTHALRASYATASALGGIPLCVIASRMGHASQRTTEGYVGRTPQRVPGPFEGQERLRVDLPSLPAVALLTG